MITKRQFLYDIQTKNQKDMIDFFLELDDKEQALKKQLPTPQITSAEVYTKIDSLKNAFTSSCHSLKFPLNNPLSLLMELCQPSKETDFLRMQENALLHLFFDTTMLPPDHQLQLTILAIVIFDNGLLFPINHKQRLSKENVLQYLQLKDNIDAFFQKTAENISLKKSWKIAKQRLTKLKANSRLCQVSPEHVNNLRTLFETYIQSPLPKGDFFKNNIHYLQEFTVDNPTIQQLEPLLLFLIFTQKKTALSTQDLLLESFSTLLTYQEYIISYDNGKNFNTSLRYIQLFCELIKTYRHKSRVNIPLCIYGFSQLNNLYLWLYDNHLANPDCKNPEQTYDYSILEDIVSGYDLSIFLQDNFLPSSIHIQSINDDFTDHNDFLNFDSQIEDSLSVFIHKQLSDSTFISDYIQAICQGKVKQKDKLEEIKRNFLQSKYFTNKNLSKETLRLLTSFLELELQNSVDQYIRYLITEYVNKIS